MIEEKNLPKTPLSELGEFGLIAHLNKNFKTIHPETTLSVGDDAAVIDLKKNTELVVSTDLLAEGIHFNLQYCPLKHLGYKSVIVNLSDIIAMGATPKQILVSIAVSSKYTVEALEELYQGIESACKNYQVDLIGGDTSASSSGMVISITAIGTVEKGKSIKRSGANPNELVVVSGDLGAAYMGLQVLERENKVFQSNPAMQPQLNDYTYLLERQLKPEAKLSILQKLQENRVLISSAIDISDGLSSEILHLSKASQVGIRIFENKIPIDHETIKAAEELNISPMVCAMHGGEDYELLFTAPIQEKDKLSQIQGLSIIGYTTDIRLGNVLVAEDHTEVEITAQGWNSFRLNTTE